MSSVYRTRESSKIIKGRGIAAAEEFPTNQWMAVSMDGGEMKSVEIFMGLALCQAHKYLECNY